MLSIKNKYLLLLAVILVIIQSLLLPIQSAFSETLNPKTILSPDGEEKSEEVIEALQQGSTGISTFSSGANVVYNGPISYGPSTVGQYTVDGKQAFCVEHLQGSPPTGSANDGGSIYKNKKIAAALYYGWGGPKNIFDDRAQGIVVTSLVLSHLKTGTNNGQNLSGFDELLAKANSEDVPNTEMTLSDSDLSSSIVNGEQKTQTTKFNADPQNAITFTVPDGVTLHNVTKDSTATGKQTTIHGGESFYFTAPQSYNQDFRSGKLEGTIKAYQPILYVMTNTALQTLGQGIYTDPTETVSFIARFEVRDGGLEIEKEGDNGKLLAGAQYNVIDNEGKVVSTVTTGTNGKAKIPDIPVGVYDVVEIKAPPGYTIDRTPRQVSVEAGSTAVITFTNKEVFFQIRVKKEDVETGNKPQGEAVLHDARYGIFLDSSLTEKLDEVTIGSDLNGLSKKIPLGGYSKTVYVKELVAPIGYNLDPNIYPVTINQTDDEKVLYLEIKPVQDKVIKGYIDLRKYWIPNPNNGGSGIMNNLESVEFKVTAKKDGQVVDTIVTDQNGHAKTKALPYGHYIVSETRTPEGVLPIDPFEVFVNEEGKVYSYQLLDDNLTAILKIVKVDSETDKVIPISNVKFKVKDLSKNEFIKIEDQDTFKTDDTGQLYIPINLKAGKYQIYEQSAPYGYVLSKQPVEFEVKNATVNAHGVVTVAFRNNPQKGVLNLIKTGEKLAGSTKQTTNYGDQYQFTFSQQPLEGAEFEMRAGEDIITPDGTIRHKKGDIVDYVVTGAGGKVTSNPHYLGKYELIERKAPAGYLISDEVHEVEFTYAGQDVEVTSDSESATNTLQDIGVEIYKQGEEVSKWSKGSFETEMKPLEGVTFGVFTRNDISVGGTVVVPKDSLVAVTTTDKEGIGHVKQKFPQSTFYVKELDTTKRHVLNDKQQEFTYTPVDNQKVYPIHVFGDSVAYDQEILLRIARTPIDNFLYKAPIKIEKEMEVIKGVEKTSKVIYEYKKEKVDFKPVTFEVFNQDNIVVDSISLNDEGKGQTIDLPVGHYYIQEKTTSDLHVLDPNIYHVQITKEDIRTETVKSIGEHSTKDIVKTSKTPITDTTNNELKVNLSLKNDLIKGKLLFKKTDASNGDVIPGAEINIKGLDENNKLIDITFISKKGGNEIPELPKGKYQITEILAPKGYIKTTEKGMFEIKEDGDIVKAELKNKRFTIKVLPRTGEGLPILPIAIGCTLIGLAFVLVGLKRRKLLN